MDVMAWVHWEMFCLLVVLCLWVRSVVDKDYQWALILMLMVYMWDGFVWIPLYPFTQVP